MPQKINKEGIDLIKKWEGFCNYAYKDIKGIPTIGFGFTEGIKMGDTISKEDAELRLKNELIHFEKCINELTHRDLTDNQFSALVCLTYNIGCRAYEDSTLLKLLNKGASDKECSLQFLRWNKANGKEVQGLTNRREQEKELFLKT